MGSLFRAHEANMPGFNSQCSYLRGTSFLTPTMTTMTKAPAAPRPGAMSLLDKYSELNSSIEDARRRVAEVRTNLERTNIQIHSLREGCNTMLVETDRATTDKTKLEIELKAAKESHRVKVGEMEDAKREHRIAKSVYDGVRRRIDGERSSFIERCREFRSAVKRLRVASSIFVLDGAGVGGGEVDDTGKGGDIWRRLQDDEEFLADVDDEGRDDGNGHRSKRKKETDPEIEEAEREERESRQALIEAECALHDERARIDEAAKLSNARNQRLTQQRAQLQRHRKEVEEMEREIHLVKDDIVKENQLANSFEKGKE